MKVPAVRNLYLFCGKAILDRFLACIGLLLLAVPIAILWVVIRIVDGAPVIFSQRRVGRFGSIFTIYKFRTMDYRHGSDVTVTVAGDRRVTSLGKVLRRCKLDELPQLLCVALGDMSFVGPRPDVEGYMDRLQGEDREVLTLRPGITGPATLKYRDEEAILAGVSDPLKYNDTVIFPDKVRINREYIRKCSFVVDLKILLTTVGALTDKGNFWSAE